MDPLLSAKTDKSIYNPTAAMFLRVISDHSQPCSPLYFVHPPLLLILELFEDHLLLFRVNGPYDSGGPSIGQFNVRWSVAFRDGDEMEIKGCWLERFKPIYCGSVHISRSRGKP